jgi:hypothetical protein
MRLLRARLGHEARVQISSTAPTAARGSIEGNMTESVTPPSDARPEPQEPVCISFGEYEYNGRRFYGTGMGCNGHADLRAELTYLRDWKQWAERQLRGKDLR